MENFDLESYYSELEKSQSINECPKVPLPKIREDQNYIFVSYAHTDYKDVYKTLAFLYANGVRFWYDSGLTYGKNWDDEVRQKIRNPNCSGAVFFLSDNLFLSKSVINIELPCILGIDSNGEKIAGVNPLDYFSINLTVKLPGDIMLDILPELRSRGIGASWIKMLFTAFEDETTYISPREFDYEGKLLEHISKKFNVTEVAPNSAFEKPIYYGEYKNGKYHGKGKLIYPESSERDFYYGEFNEGKLHGNGQMFYKDGTVFEGEFDSCEIIGRFEATGKIIYSNGDVYEGEWKDDNPEGRGVKRYKNGDVYEGDWVNGKHHGNGKMSYVGGNVYDGEWVNGKREGKCIYTFASGEKYEGEFKDGRFHGHGVFRYLNGDVYEGEWKGG
ncbi:MAG: TIR domain-containing protein, partial [Clostridia bacterium]|nr:TIR domain-containing protein [Clostridia bacterium]